MKTNKAHLVIQSVQGRVHHPTMRGAGYRVGFDGWGRIPMATGGITYNYAIGDCCMGIAGDHIEPGVSLKNADASENDAMNAFACIGNTAKVLTGDAKGELGFVTGKHGGIDHVMIYFPSETLEKMAVDDKVLIKAHGQGMKLLDYEEVMVMNTDPELFDKLGIEEKDGKLIVPVTHIIPAYLMGSGLGSATLMSGDYDITTQDKEAVKELGLDTLRFGDIVYIQDNDGHNGAHYLKGSGSVGVIVHSDSFPSGHGPGVFFILTCKKDTLKPKICKDANIANYLLK